MQLASQQKLITYLLTLLPIQYIKGNRRQLITFLWSTDKEYWWGQ